MEKKDKGAKISTNVGSRGKKSKQGSENDDPHLQEFLQVMQPRVNSKLWANDTLGVPPLDHISKTSDKQIQSKREGKDEAVQMQADLNESDERETGSSDGQMDTKPKNVAHDEVISDMDYFKSRVRKKWSDSESDDDSESGDGTGSNDDSESDDDNEDHINSLNKKSIEGQDVQKVGQLGQHNTIQKDAIQEKVDVEDHAEESDGERMDSGNPSSSLKDGKDVLETGRLFVRNLPYTATYNPCFLFAFFHFSLFFYGVYCSRCLLQYNITSFALPVFILIEFTFFFLITLVF